ncbi:MAG: winged helix-turn-helix transcriptional regulator [Nocardioidaceae bacterium]|jgi:ArsR family transcriptional regulator|nr:winged helix-turn-helix transcriptional regulator [Nocardioidaceae bacterium]
MPTLRPDSPDTDHVERVSMLFKSLSSPVRLTLLIHLMEGGHTVHELVDHLSVSQPLVSQHLRVLRSAGLVRAESVGRERVYTITDEHVSHIVRDALQHVTEVHDGPAH